MIGQLDNELGEAREAICGHPAGGQRLSRSLLCEFALTQWGDSVVWVPMLATMRDRVNNPRLRQALDANLRCEAGVDALRSHVTLCRQFVMSLGLQPGLIPSRTRLGGYASAMTDITPLLTEPQIAGWILASESLVPALFTSVIDQFRQAGADIAYLVEHISVDDEEHAQWMREASIELISTGGGPAFGQILFGARLAARATISVLDTLYALSLGE